jgi:3-carboxy-cis,cis-muconate cycloisomerase
MEAEAAEAIISGACRLCRGYHRPSPWRFEERRGGASASASPLKTNVASAFRLRRKQLDDLAVGQDWCGRCGRPSPARRRDKVHIGATSQDFIDTRLMLRLEAATEIIAARLGRLIDTLEETSVVVMP